MATKPVPRNVSLKKKLIGGTLIAALLLFSLTATAGANEVLAVSFVNDATAPAGIRRNNPGNMRVPNSWTPVGMTGSANGFAVFSTFQYGLAALLNLIAYYYLAAGYNTITTIAYRYAPPVENDTENWIHVVSQISGIAPDFVIDNGNTDAIFRLIGAIVSMENGRTWGDYAYNDLNQPNGAAFIYIQNY